MCKKPYVWFPYSGSLDLLNGERVIGEGLNMGVFTQDLAQDLPLDQPALTYVLDTVRASDPSISDQRARGEMIFTLSLTVLG